MTSPPPVSDYQNDPKHPPDKTDGWTINDDNNDDGWKLSHDALRHELECLTKAVTVASAEQRPLESWHIQSLQSIWKYHYDHLTKHQAAEEAFYFPFMQQRIRFPESVASQHGEIVQAAKAIDDKFSTLNSEFKSLGQDLVSGVHKLDQDERALMDQEESFLLPCMRAFFTQDEVKDVQRRMGQEGGHSGSFVYVIGEERFRNHTMHILKIPFFVWNIAFKPDLKQYQKRVVQHVEAIETNVKPAVKKGSWFGRN